MLGLDLSLLCFCRSTHLGDYVMMPYPRESNEYLHDMIRCRVWALKSRQVYQLSAASEQLNIEVALDAYLTYISSVRNREVYHKQEKGCKCCRCI